MEIDLKEIYVFDSRNFSKVSEFFEDVVLKETKGESLPPKHLGDVWIDNNTLLDVKSLDIKKEFHMSNLASQRKLLKWLGDENNSLLYSMIFYEKNDENITIHRHELKHIEELDPDFLIVNAQGWGVLQYKIPEIDGVFTPKFIKKMPRDKWLNEVLAVKVNEYLDREEKKIEKTREEYSNFMKSSSLELLMS